MSLTDLPARARVVVIGGGVIGASIAYHLTHEGVTDVVLLERDRLTSGTTWHAAGLMTCFGSTSETLTRLRLYSRDLYSRLESETGLSTGFKRVGLIEAAADADRLEEYRRAAVFQRHIGLEVEEIGPREMAELFPLARTDDLLAGFWVPGDGRVNPVDLTMSLARGARDGGARVIEQCPVTDVLTRSGRVLREVTGVRTARGDIECEVVVNATGMWARQFGERHGVVIPNQAAEHYYLVTEPMGADPNWPVFEDPAAFGYYREEGGGLMVGLFEPEAAAWRVEGVPEDFSFGQIPVDWDRITRPLEVAMARIPSLDGVGVRTFFCGPESFTPDRLPAVGEAPGVRGYFVAAGLNSVGVLSAGGLGRIVAHWVAHGRPDVDVTAMDVARFQPWELAAERRSTRTAEVLGMTYTRHTPGTQLRSGRGYRVSPVHERVVAAGGWLRDVSGMEAADWYAGPGRVADAEPSWGRAEWFAHWEAEHRAVREGVGLLDMSFMSRFEVNGADAARLLERLSTARVAERGGRITYTQWLDAAGHIVADLTVTRLADHRFVVIASDTAQGNTAALLARAVEDHPELEVTVREVTDDWAMFSLQGPRSRAVLAAAGNEAGAVVGAIGYRDVVELTISGVAASVARITYVGELGFEISVPCTDALRVWDALVMAGEPHGLRPTGLHALASLRLEKGYRDFGHDIDNTDTLGGAGLGFTASLEKPGGFVGRDAVLAQRAEGAPTGRIVSVLLTDPEPLLFGAEVVCRDGQPVGYLRSASYGWTVGGAVGLAFLETAEAVTANWLAAGAWTVRVADRVVPARVSLGAWYDPGNERIHG